MRRFLLQFLGLLHHVAYFPRHSSNVSFYFRSREAINQRNVSLLADSVNSKLLKMLISTTVIYALSFATSIVSGLISFFLTSSSSHETSPGKNMLFTNPIIKIKILKLQFKFSCTKCRYFWE